MSAEQKRRGVDRATPRTRDIVYYCVHVSTTGPGKWQWSEACHTPKEATQIQRDKIDSGEASVAFVVRMCPERGKEILRTSILPLTASKAIRNFLELEGMLRDG